MKPETFKTLSPSEIAQLTAAQGSKVCVFPVNGTRRWFMLEYKFQPGDDPAKAYVEACVQRQIEIYRMFFNYGVDTVLSPMFGPDLLERGQEYMEMAAHGLASLVNHPAMLAFYEECDVRVRFYGDYRKYFAGTSYTYLCDLFDEITARTLNHSRNRVFYGIFAHDPAETTAELAVRYHAKHGTVPNRRALVEMYYGESVPPVSLFIGFDKFSAFDMPLLNLGNEDLYFTVSPSSYFNEQQLRDILYDHLFARRVEETDYADLNPGDWLVMRQFYHQNLTKTLGVGAVQTQGNYWYPLPQVSFPDETSGWSQIT
jgi:adenosine tuberculosinyltransferase